MNTIQLVSEEAIPAYVFYTILQNDTKISRMI